MTFEQDFRSRLLGTFAISNIVGTRIFWGVRPQKTPFPCIVLTMVSDTRPKTHDGYVGFWSSLVQIDVYGSTRAAVSELRELIILLIGTGGTQGGTMFSTSFIEAVRDLSEDTGTGFIHRDSIEASVWHN